MGSTRNSAMLVVSACHFGWGSLGKLRLILKHLPPHRIILHEPPPMSTQILALDDFNHEFVDAPLADANAALVINDPERANYLGSLGIPVVYVDSLPYLWANGNEVPLPNATVCYCAQRYPDEILPLASCLRNRRDFCWVEPIVPQPRRRTGGAGVVVNVGGVHSHLCGTLDYVDLVLPGVLGALEAASVSIAGVCGNIGSDWLSNIRQRFGNDVVVGVQSGHVFEQLLRTCDLLLTSPGSTTIFQAMQIGLPSILLPPQNLSQILNTRLFVDPECSALNWPDSVLSTGMIEALRPAGEEKVVNAIYSALAEARKDPAKRAEITESLRSGLSPLQMAGHVRRTVSHNSGRGAHQVAQIIRQACLAPYKSRLSD